MKDTQENTALHCPNCKKSVEPNYAFCPYCSHSMESVHTEKHHSRKLIFLFCCFACGLICTGIVLLSEILPSSSPVILPSSSPVIATKASQENSVVYGLIDRNGTAYVPLMNGEVYTLKGHYQDVALCADRTKIVALTEDGTLSWVNVETQQEIEVAEHIEDYTGIKNSGFFYWDDSGNYFRYLFADQSDLSLGPIDDYILSKSQLNTAYVKNEAVYLLLEAENHPTKIGSYKEDVYLQNIAEDGSLIVWLDHGSSKDTINVYENGKPSTLGELRNGGSYSYARTYLANHNTLLVACSDADNILLLKQNGQESIQVELGDTLGSKTLYTETGILGEEDTPIEGFYTMVSNGGQYGNILYWIPLETGKRERIVTNVEKFVIHNGRIAYLTDDGDLCTASIKGSNLTERAQVDHEVFTMELGNDGRYVYYVKDVDDNAGKYDYSGTLCGYRLGDEAPFEIGSDAGKFMTATTDEVVFYWTHLTDIRDTYSEAGTLTRFNAKDKTSAVVADDVLEDSLSSGLTRSICPELFLYEQYTSSNSDGDIIVDWYYNIDGTDKPVASNVLD